ncbi:hypothetical protein ACNF46_014555 (plasmid) [Mammaliicoccus sciuri]|uniref:hypothetical protein n=1 Tax=Mammaliicoccus sciuri TaxID=1296 RepID=UPI003AC10E42
MYKNVVNFEENRIVKEFMNGKLKLNNEHAKELYNFLITLIDISNHHGKNVTEYEMYKFLIELKKMDITREVHDYLDFIITQSKIVQIFESIENEKLSFIMQHNRIYDLGEVIMEDANDIAIKLIKIFRNMLCNSRDITVYDVDFMIIGFYQKTQFEGSKKFIENIVDITQTYPRNLVKTPFQSSIVNKDYEDDHLSYLKDVLERY